MLSANEGLLSKYYASARFPHQKGIERYQWALEQLRLGLGLSTLCSQLVEELRVKILDRRNKRPRPRNLRQVDFAWLKIFLVILALGEDRSVRCNHSTATPKLVAVLNANPVDIG